MNTKGRFITFEGPDTAGKTVLLNKLQTALPLIYPDETFLFTREPGNLLNGNFNKSETIREKLLTDRTLTTKQQAKLFAESRYYHVIDIIKALNEGKHVLTDRFLFSSIIYQGLELGFQEVLEMNKETLQLLANNNIDINNIVLQISTDTYEERMSNRVKDAMEDIEQSKIYDRIMYHSLVRTVNEMLGNQLGNIYSIDANQKQPSVTIEALNHINKILR